MNPQEARQVAYVRFASVTGFKDVKEFMCELKPSEKRSKK